MSRGIGMIEWFRGNLPPNAMEAFAVVTQLGDTWFIFVLGALCYWFLDDRERFGFVLAATLGALALTLALKGIFERPRPDELLRPAFVHATGYGFPSGHAIGSTVFWGLLALALDRGTRRTRLAVAGVIVTLVSLSRVVIGVHFVVDVVVGVAVGIAYLVVVVRGLDWRPTAALVLAVGCAIGAVLVADWSVDAVATLGGAVGAFLTWRAVGPAEGGVGPVAAAVGLLALGALSYVGLAVPVPLLAVFVINAVVQGGIFAYPSVAGGKIGSGGAASELL